MIGRKMNGEVRSVP